MITLPHTVLHVPHDRLRVTSLRELPTSNGVAFTANLRLDRKQVGVIEDAGRGGGPLFSPYPDTGFGFTALNAFAAACRHHGEPVSTERLLSDLVTFADRQGHFTGPDLRLYEGYMFVTLPYMPTRSSSVPSRTHADCVAETRSAAVEPARCAALVRCTMSFAGLL